MKKYNYQNIDESEHVKHNWEPLNFEIKDDYDFVPQSKVFNFFSNIVAFIVIILLFLINKVLYGYKIENKKKLKKKGGFVSISNHVHPMDCTMIALLYYSKRVYYPTLASNFKIPFIRHLIRILYAMPIPSSEKQKAKFYNQINDLLKNKRVLQMYPEGSLWPYYEDIRHFKHGAFKMAVDANVPVQIVKFIFVKPKGIYKLYKRNKCIHLKVVDYIYPNLKLDYDNRIEDLKNRSYEIMKESSKK